MTKPKLDISNDVEYGSAANGTQVGSGYDADIKRESDSVALVNVTEVASRKEWLGDLPVEADENLQALAVLIAQAPGDWLHELARSDEDGWSAYAKRWDAIGV